MRFILVKFALWISGVSAQGYVFAGNGFYKSDQEAKQGNQYNYWKTLPNVLCIIEMQNYFLHPALAPTSDDGRAPVAPTVELVKSFRKNDIKMAWLNWGLTTYDLVTMSPSPASSTGADLGMVQDGNETIYAGRALMADTWNVRPYGILKNFVHEGVRAGTDFVIPKNRLSGLWGGQTAFGLWLQQHEITTIFIGGVDADQCVRSTYMDAYFKGYDVVYVDDIAATRNGAAAYENTTFIDDYTNFLANTSAIIDALS